MTADELLHLTPGAPVLCDFIAVTSLETHVDVSPFLGEYEFTGEFSCGRQAFKHKE